MKIVFCGPPHSGKSVFIANIRNKMPSDGHAIIRACPDGEGNWSNNDDQNMVTVVRKKGKFTNEFIENICDIIDRQQNDIIIVDVGGVISKENEKIFKHCDSFVVISNDEEKSKEWVDFGKSLGLECIGVIDSKLEGNDEIYSEKPYLQGRVTNLERGKQKESQIIDSLANVIIVRSGYTEKEVDLDENNEVLIDDTQIGSELGCLSEEYVDVKDENVNVVEKKKIKKVNWKKEVMPDLNNLVLSKVSEGKDVRLFGVRANFVFSTICCSCRKKGVGKISAYDSRTNSYFEVKHLEQKENIDEAPGLQFTIFEEGENVLMNVDIVSDTYTKEQYEKCVIPKIDKNKKIYISGRLPLWLLGAITSSYDLNQVYTMQPGNGFTCVSAVDEKDIGKVVEDIPVIDEVKCLQECKKRREEKNNIII